jgi:hypothetical protein
MAEKDGELGPDVSRRTGTKEMSSNVRLDEMNLLVAVRSPGAHRSIAGVELLRQIMAVNIGETNQRGRRSGKGSRRCGFSP